MPGNWSLVLDTEFGGSKLDSPWTTGWFGTGITQDVSASANDCLDPAQVVEGNGELDLNLIAKSETCGATKGYATGLVTTDGTFTYTFGFTEARIWAPGSGACVDWPSFWADGTGTWPTTGENDVYECLSGLACWHFHDPSGGPGGCTSAVLTGGWHTVAADWEPGSVTYYYDGAQVGSITSGITSSPMYLILGLGVGGSGGGALQAPATMRVDYVRVWQHTAALKFGVGQVAARGTKAAARGSHPA